MKLSVTKLHKEYLLNNVVTENNDIKQVILNGEYQNEKWVFDISTDFIDELRDLCSKQLQISGFDENYELTDEGEILEDLIDLLYLK